MNQSIILCMFWMVLASSATSIGGLYGMYGPVYSVFRPRYLHIIHNQDRLNRLFNSGSYRTGQKHATRNKLYTGLYGNALLGKLFRTSRSLSILGNL